MKKIIILMMMVSFWMPFAEAEAKVKVAATSTYFADIARKVGGEYVEVATIASPKFNAHFYQPTPGDIRKVRNADLYVHWGLDMEAWSDPLVQAAGKAKFFRGREGSVDLSEGIHLLHVPTHELSRSEGDVHVFGNPHYLLDPRNCRVIAKNLANRLAEKDPSNEVNYQNNLTAFLNKLDQKMVEWKSLCSHCKNKEIIPYHDDTTYLADFLGIENKMFVEPKPGVPPTAQHLQHLEKYAKENSVTVLTAATYSPLGKIRSFANRIDGEVVIIAQNVGEISGTDSVFDFFDYNINQLSEALR